MYAQKIEGDSWLGERLDSAKIEKMSGHYYKIPTFSQICLQPLDQQLGQLYELMQAIQKREREGDGEDSWKTPWPNVHSLPSAKKHFIAIQHQYSWIDLDDSILPI